MNGIKQFVFLWLILHAVSFAHAQRTLVPNKQSSKKEMFGKRDLNEYRALGLQLSVGATATIPTRDAPITHQHNLSGRPPYSLTTDPDLRLGAFAEIGLIHYPKRQSKLSQKLNYIFVSYIDWGLGLKVHRGYEQTQVDQLHPTDFSVVKSQQYQEVFRNTLATARITVHKNFYIRKKYFIDNGLGINVDFVVKKDEFPDYTQQINQYVPELHRFQTNPQVLLHYELGFGFRLNRRSLLIPTLHFPIVGIHSWRHAASDFIWFDSNYYPFLMKVKWTYLFGKNDNKHCPPVYTNEQDKNTMNKQ